MVRLVLLRASWGTFGIRAKCPHRGPKSAIGRLEGAFSLATRLHMRWRTRCPRRVFPFWTESRTALRSLRGWFRLSFRPLFGQWTYVDKLRVSRKYPKGHDGTSHGKEIGAPIKLSDPGHNSFIAPSSSSSTTWVRVTVVDKPECPGSLSSMMRSSRTVPKPDLPVGSSGNCLSGRVVGRRSSHSGPVMGVEIGSPGNGRFWDESSATATLTACRK